LPPVERAHHDYPERVETEGQDHDPNAVPEAQDIRVDHVGRDEAAVEQHREKHDEHEEPAEFERHPAERIGEKAYVDHAYDGPDDRGKQRNAIRPRHGGLLTEHQVVRFERNFPGNQPVAVAHYGVLRGDRNAEHEQNGQYASRGEQDEDDVDHQVGLWG
jgi:hypothetical protein